MILKRLIVLLVLGLSFGFCLSQTKNEREERIDFKDLPETIEIIVDEFPKEIKKLKFYKESDGEHHSYEVKFKYNSTYYSVEFDTIGNIEDIEILIKERHFKNPVKSIIESYFNKTFKKVKIIKIQKQFVFSDAFSANAFISKVLDESIETTINYEIIAEVTDASKRNIREFTFNQNGEFINYRTLSQPYYGHVLNEN